MPPPNLQVDWSDICENRDKDDLIHQGVSVRVMVEEQGSAYCTGKSFFKLWEKTLSFPLCKLHSVLTENYLPKLASPYRQIYGTPYQKDTTHSSQSQTCTSGQAKMTRNVRSNRCVFSSQLVFTDHSKYGQFLSSLVISYTWAKYKTDTWRWHELAC